MRLPTVARPAVRRSDLFRPAVLFVVVGLLVAGVLYDRVDAPRPTSSDVDVAAIVTPSISDPARLDGAWFCPTGSSTAGGYADHVVQVSNLSDQPAVANLGILRGEGRGPTLRVPLDPLSTQEISLSSIAESEVAGAVVEIIGGTGVVAHRVTTASGQAQGPCATHVSSSWYFASGRTERDSRNYLALMNPFPEDVVYNIELYRSVGRPRRPDDLQGGVVRAGSVQVVNIDEYLQREDAVAATIHTVRGRLVAERLQVVDGQLGPTGAALQLGVAAPAASWMLPAGRIHEAGDDRVIVFNPGEETATVEVELWPTNPTDRSLYGLAPIPRELLPGRFEVVDLRIEADRYGLRLPYEVGVSVTSTNGVPVVAERWQYAIQPASPLGIGDTSTGDGEGAGAGEEPTDEGDTSGEEPSATDDAAEGETEPASEEVEPSEDGVAAGELDVPGILGGEASELVQPTAVDGIATSRGTEVVSDRWIIPWVSTPGENATAVIVTSVQEAQLKIFLLINGEMIGPMRESVPPGGRAIIPLAATTAGAPVVVTADVAVSVEAQVVGPDGGLAVVPGVPTVRR